MPENKDNRVLSRLGARELSQKECDSISAGFSVRCTAPPPGGCPDRPCSLCPP